MGCSGKEVEKLRGEEEFRIADCGLRKEGNEKLRRAEGLRRS